MAGEEIKKTTVKLGGIALAANQGITWKFVSGVAPYKTTLTVHKKVWDTKLKQQKGKPLKLEITSASGKQTVIDQVYILQEAPSDSPYRASFVVSDKRWKWQYQLIVRDFNMVRKTGDRTAKLPKVPVETRVVVDKFDYLPYSLNGDTKWTAKDTVREIMSVIEDSKEGGSWRIDSFPIAEKKAPAGEFTIQGVSLRDPGDVALARMLSYIPGADVYINAEGKAVIYDATDIDALQKHFGNLPASTYSGENAVWIDRIKVRPNKVIVHYQREVEVVLEYRDDYGSTIADPNRDSPYLDNVIPTVDQSTTITEYDPGVGSRVTKVVPPGTWVRIDDWLKAMDADKPSGSCPWTFETIKTQWLVGDLEGVLGARGLDIDNDANISMRVQALRQHFRQTFRINRRYMERIRDIRAVRVALLDPLTGARAPAAVWGQATIVPSEKGKRMAVRNADPQSKKIYRIVDYLAPSDSPSVNVIETSPGPTRVNIIDKELGIFRLEWIVSPYGTDNSFIPCKLASQGTTTPKVPTRDMSLQGTEPIAVGARVESGSNSVHLATVLEYKVLLTIVPSSPNSELQFHREEVEAEDVSKLFQKELAIKDGDGPDLEVFVPPSEATARFAWYNDLVAPDTIKDLLGLRKGANQKVGIIGTDLPGLVIINHNRELSDHAISLATQVLAPYADNLQGTVATGIPAQEMKLVGNMSGAAIRVAQAPSAKVDAIHRFPGQQRPISRFAVMSDATRSIVLHTLTFKE